MPDTYNSNGLSLPTGRLADKACGALVTVLGFGISNRPLVRILCALGARVTVYDSRTAEELGEPAQTVMDCGVRFTTDIQEALSPTPSLIFRTPGIRPDHSAITAAVGQGAELTSEMAWFLEITPATVIGITGSDGKTTTSTLTAKMLEAAGHRVYLGGNIGTPLLPLVTEMTKEDFAVVELSSFQLCDLAPALVPHRAALTNLTRNHLNWHVDMEEYICAKTHIYSGARCSLLVTNADNRITAELAEQQKDQRSVLLFSTQKTPNGDALSVKNGQITLAKNGTDTSLLAVSDILLPGEHNVQNYMTAIGLVHDLVTPEAIRSVATAFAGVKHRLEHVRTLHGVTYYNSSIDSTPARTRAALSALPKAAPIVAICGGYDKNSDYAPLAEALCARVRAVVLTGATAEKILSAIQACPDYDKQRLQVIREPDFTAAVHAAAKVAKEGDIVLLSPACASFDAFPNFEVRGEAFRQLILALPENEKSAT